MIKNVDLIVKAFEFAITRHKIQERKPEGSKISYICHLMDVASILTKNMASDDLVAAGFLHDVVEDNKYTEVTEEDLRAEFGDIITELVMAVTERDKSLDWKTRKTIMIEKLASESKEVQMLKCADSLANLKDSLSDYALGGIDALNKFKGDLSNQLWQFKSILDALEKIKDLPMYSQYEEAVKRFGTILSDNEIKLTDVGKIARL